MGARLPGGKVLAGGWRSVSATTPSAATSRRDDDEIGLVRRSSPAVPRGVVSLGVGEQPLPHLDRVLGGVLGAAVAGAVQQVGARQPVDAVDSRGAERGAGGHRTLSVGLSPSSASRARMRRAASPPVSMLMLSSW